MAASMAPAYAEKNYFANAGDFIEAYNDHTKDNLLQRMFIRGIGEGIMALSAFVNEGGGKPVYCPPPNVGLVDAQYVAIMTDHIAKYPSIKDKPVSLVLVSALEEAFPCRGNGR